MAKGLLDIIPMKIPDRIKNPPPPGMSYEIWRRMPSDGAKDRQRKKEQGIIGQVIYEDPNQAENPNNSQIRTKTAQTLGLK